MTFVYVIRYGKIETNSLSLSYLKINMSNSNKMKDVFSLII